jgi:hypothetical protein
MTCADIFDDCSQNRFEALCDISALRALYSQPDGGAF